MFDQLQEFLYVIVACISAYIIYQVYQFRKLLLLAGVFAVLGYIGYLIYGQRMLTNEVAQKTTEIKEKSNELQQIKKTLAEEDFNNTRSLGYRLNNPGNIRKSSTTFKGEVESPEAFKQFKSMKYGFRAMTSLLHTYINSGFNTVETILNRYAPSSDGNNPVNYTKSVIKLANVRPDQALSTPDFKNGNMLNIMYAMTRVEQGYSPNIHDLHEGYMMYVREINLQVE